MASVPSRFWPSVIPRTMFRRDDSWKLERLLCSAEDFQNQNCVLLGRLLFSGVLRSYYIDTKIGLPWFECFNKASQDLSSVELSVPRKEIRSARRFRLRQGLRRRRPQPWSFRTAFRLRPIFALLSCKV